MMADLIAMQQIDRNSSPNEAERAVVGYYRDGWDGFNAYCKWYWRMK